MWVGTYAGAACTEVANRDCHSFDDAGQRYSHWGVLCTQVVGPLPNRAITDKVLPLGYSAISSLDMDVGNTPVDPAYENITRHNKWVIPWMEDDPGLTAPQLWVNRTLEHMNAAESCVCPRAPASTHRSCHAPSLATSPHHRLTMLARPCCCTAATAHKACSASIGARARCRLRCDVACLRAPRAFLVT